MRSKTYLKRVFKTISKYKLVENGDVIFVALSGGKDSASALFALKTYIEHNNVDCELKGFHINFDLPISEKVVKTVEKQVKMAGVELIVVSTKDLGISLAEAVKKTRRPICSICGVLKRYILVEKMRQTPHSLQMHEINIVPGKGIVVIKPVEVRKEDITLPKQVMERIQRSMEKKEIELP